uniref:Translocon Sec61/SecY plug domain-containing protein n=1 Tax=Oryza punctata TaxID=4537 RepID=A0A0E0KHP3_ORYPU
MAGRSSSSSFRLLDLVRPFMPLLPVVREPDRRVPFRRKLACTAAALFAFLACSQLPLYGIHRAAAAAGGADPFYWVRAILASNRGTVMELGITPVVTAGTLVQLLVGSNLVRADSANRDDRTLLSAAQKLLSIVITAGEATAYVLSGAYGSVGVLGAGNSVLIVLQLVFGGMVVIFLDELLQKGYGFGSGISLFTAANTCESIVTKALSPATVNRGRGAEFVGAITATAHLLATRANKLSAVREAFFRGGGLPDLCDLAATCIVFLAAVYLQGLRVTLPVRPRNAPRGHRGGTYSVRLLYTSGMPVVLLSSAVSSLYLVSQALYHRFGGSFVVDLLGKWTDAANAGHSVPIGGIAYYMTAPASMASAAANPFHAAFYVAFVLAACATLSKAWVVVSGSSSRDVARQLREQQMVMPGMREASMQRELERYIPAAAALGGVCIGALTVAADLMGAVGSGAGMLLAVTTVYQCYEAFEKEKTY